MDYMTDIHTIAEKLFNWGSQLAPLIGIAIVSFLCAKLFRHLIIPVIHKVTSRTKATWDDYLFNRTVIIWWQI